MSFSWIEPVEDFLPERLNVMDVNVILQSDRELQQLEKLKDSFFKKMHYKN